MTDDTHTREAARPYRTGLGVRIGLGLCVGSLLPLHAARSAPAEVPPPLALEQALDAAALASPDLEKCEWRVRRAGLLLSKVKAMRVLPKAQLSLRGGLVPEARGDALTSPDESDDQGGYGPYVKADVALVQPLYTFGRVKTGMAAAKQARLAEQQRTIIVRQKLDLAVMSAYSGATSAAAAREIASDLKGQYEELLSEVATRVKDADSDVDHADLFEVQSAAYDVEKALQDSTRDEEYAWAAMDALLDGAEATRPALAPMVAPSFDLPEDVFRAMLPDLVSAHPEVHAFRGYVQALDAKRAAAAREIYPTIYLAGGYGYARADNRDDQTNPFVYDDWNYSRLGVQLGLNWDLGLPRHRHALKEARIELGVARADLDRAHRQVRLAVLDSYLSARRDAALLASAASSGRAARKWVNFTAENWRMGVGEVGRMLRAYRSFYERRATEIEQEHLYRESLAKLAYHCGDTRKYLQWVAQGRVGHE